MFLGTTAGESFFFLSSGNVFLNEPFIPAIGEGFFSLVEHVRVPHRNKHKTHFSVQKNSIVFYSELFFQLVETIIEIIEKQNL